MFDTKDLKIMNEDELLEQLELLEWNYYKFSFFKIYTPSDYSKYRQRIIYYLNKVQYAK